MLSRAAVLKNALEATIRVGVVLLLALWCFRIVQPFIDLLVGSAIIAIAVYPGYLRIQKVLGGRHALAATLVTLLGILVVITPTVILSDTFIRSSRELAVAFNEGRIVIPPPSERVSGLPYVGESIYRVWKLASTNVAAALEDLAPQLKVLSTWLLGAAAGVGLAIIKLIVTMVLAGVFLAHTERASGFVYRLAARLAGERGAELANLAQATVRSVSRGILGVAVIQSMLAGVGFLAAGIPGAGLWVMICLVLSVLQIGPLLVLLGATIYMFATASATTATIFAAWSVLVSLTDNVLKPLLLGRGLHVPMLVVFVGAIGGVLRAGLLGLFVGPIVLVLGYTLLQGWLEESRQPRIGRGHEPDSASPPPPSEQGSRAKLSR